MPAPQQGFDYVIVGAGSAGCILANRLSADPTVRVLLLEAGGPDANFWLRLPVGYFRTIYDPRFSRLFESALDAIIELDEQFGICRANRSALAQFGVEEGEATGRSLLEFLTGESADKLRALTRNLAASSSSSIWVPGGFDALRADGVGFPAEASLARFQFGDDVRFTLILRNIHHQIEAEKKIAMLASESAYLQEEIGDVYNFGEILGRSRIWQEMLNSIHQVGPTDATVLIQGETGTGKELVARAIHRASRRAA